MENVSFVDLDLSGHQEVNQKPGTEIREQCWNSEQRLPRKVKLNLREPKFDTHTDYNANDNRDAHNADDWPNSKNDGRKFSEVAGPAPAQSGPFECSRSFAAQLRWVWWLRLPYEGIRRARRIIWNATNAGEILGISQDAPCRRTFRITGWRSKSQPSSTSVPASPVHPMVELACREGALGNWCPRPGPQGDASRDGFPSPGGDWRPGRPKGRAKSGGREGAAGPETASGYQERRGERRGGAER